MRRFNNEVIGATMFLFDVEGSSQDDPMICISPEEERLDGKLRRADLRARRIVEGETRSERIARAGRYSLDCREEKALTAEEKITQVVGYFALVLILVFCVWPMLHAAGPRIGEAWALFVKAWTTR